MARTDSTAVQGILLSDYDSDAAPSLSPFIATATSLVDRLVIVAAVSSHILTNIELELIERWLAAHFYCNSDKPYASKETGGGPSGMAKAVFQGRTEKGLESTFYGQTALTLDWTNTLANLSAHKRASGFWLGTEEIDQRTYDQRNGVTE